MKKKFIIISTIILTFLVLLVLPLIFKDKSHPPLEGPDLSELKYSEIFFENQPDKIKLSGMVFLPEGRGPFPTAIIIHGSGPSRRNSVWYLSVAKYLQNQGIAVLLPDKRGSEKSEGKWLGASLEELANDTLAAVTFVNQQHLFEYTSIGLIGMSQGGWIAPIVATKTQDLAFVVSMSGAAVTPEEQLTFEEAHNIAPYTYTFIAEKLAPVTSSNLQKKAFFLAMAGFDPIPYWKKAQVPVFFAFGGKDKNVPVDTSINRLQENKFNHFKIKIYPEGGHAIRNVQTNKVSEAFLNDLVTFIKEVK